MVEEVTELVSDEVAVELDPTPMETFTIGLAVEADACELPEVLEPLPAPMETLMPELCVVVAELPVLEELPNLIETLTMGLLVLLDDATVLGMLEVVPKPTEILIIGDDVVAAVKVVEGDEKVAEFPMPNEALSIGDRVVGSSMVELDEVLPTPTTTLPPRMVVEEI